MKRRFPYHFIEGCGCQTANCKGNSAFNISSIFKNLLQESFGKEIRTEHSTARNVAPIILTSHNGTLFLCKFSSHF